MNMAQETVVVLACMAFLLGCGYLSGKSRKVHSFFDTISVGAIVVGFIVMVAPMLWGSMIVTYYVLQGFSLAFAQVVQRQTMSWFEPVFFYSFLLFGFGQLVYWSLPPPLCHRRS